MATLSEYFESEARDYLAQLDRDLERARPDAAILQRAARALRGSAQMAREERVVRAAGALEAAARAVAGESIRWSNDLAARARRTVADLRVLVERRQPAASLDAVADAAVARWRETGIQLPVSASKRAPDARASASREFRAFAAREVTAIADALDRGVQQLAMAPMDREPLKMILRRQRALLGAARLQQIPVVEEILRAVDDLTRVIAKLDVGVKREWLDIYRIAREGLRATIQPLQQDEDPQPSHALSRLRHMREELLERYGEGEAVSAAHESAGLTQVTTLERAPDEPVADEVIPARLSDPPRSAAPAVAAVVPEEELLLEEEVVVQLDRAAAAPVLELAEADAAPILELHEVAADEPVLDVAYLADESFLELADVADEPLLDLADVADEPLLELADVADEPVLDLADVADEPVLDLADVADEPALELADVADEPVLDLADIAEEPVAELLELDAEQVLELGAADDAEAELEPGEGGAIEEQPLGETEAQAVVPIEALLYERDEALRRALELRDLVALSAIDPVTHEAIDELFDLIGIALH